MSRLLTRHVGTAPCPAEGIRIGTLERRALDDPALRAGCALGEPFVCCAPCWERWVCARLLEHLRGERWWEELDRGDYGLLRERWHLNLELVEDIVARIATGAGSLQILVWAVESGQPLDDVVAVLRTIDVSGRRLPRFPWLSPTVPCGHA